MNCTDTVYTRFSYLCMQTKFLLDNFLQRFVVVAAAVVETFFLEMKITKTKNGKNFQCTRTNEVSHGKHIFQRSNICQE